MDADRIIAQCTRGGSTSWFNVAQMLGCSVDQARARHDPNYLRPNPFRDRQDAKLIEDAIEVLSHRSPHKGPLLKDRVLEHLAKASGTREDLALRFTITSQAANSMLRDLKLEGFVNHDGVARGRVTWSLTEIGRAEVRRLAQRSAA